ncbi:MAG: DNA mismatch repair protein MutS [Intestinimonas sp.]|nr:DNA mismatch repair protein MutS [Intestinimonas sp.]
MHLTQQIKEDTGYAWVMEKMSPASPFGRALARDPAWYGPEDREALETELDRVAQATALLRRESTALDETTHILSEFHDIRNSLNRTDGAPMDEVELFEVKHFLLNLSQLVRAYSVLPPLKDLELKPLTGLLDLLDPSGRRLPTFSVEPAFAPGLARIREEKTELEQALRGCAGAGREQLLARRRDLVRREDKLELEVRCRLTQALLEEKDELTGTMDSIGRLDLIVAKAFLALRFGCARPELSEMPEVRAVEMVHPQVADHLEERGGHFTPVSLCLRRGTCVITGANMGGKSVSLRSISLNLILMQTGFFVFAQSFSAPLFEEVSLICTDRQSVEQGLSSFGAEVAAIGEILREEREKLFFVALDEFARGTNPREGASLARSLAEYLNGRNCVALMTTHYDGVSDVAVSHYQVAGLSALDTAAIKPGEAPLDRLSRLMDYRLIPTPPDAPCPRDALRVCRLMELEPELMKIFSENS